MRGKVEAAVMQLQAVKHDGCGDAAAGAAHACAGGGGNNDGDGDGDIAIDDDRVNNVNPV